MIVLHYGRAGDDRAGHRPAAHARANKTKHRVSRRSRREAVLVAATAYFGEQGYENTKWTDVAAEAGIGSTALRLAELGAFFVPRQLAILSLPPELADRPLEAKPRGRGLTAPNRHLGPTLYP